MVSHSSIASCAIAEEDGVTGRLVLPYLYFTGPIPAFEVSLEEGVGAGRQGASYRMVTQIISVLAPVSVPDNVQPFYSIPYRFNLTTYLDPLVHDFGRVGALGLVGPPWLDVWKRSSAMAT